MQTYVFRRLLALVPTLFIASVIVFVIVRMVPGDVVDLMLSQNDAGSNKLTRDQLLETLGLDKPMWEQYGIWISNLVFRGDLGNSLWQGDTVVSMIAARLPVTFELGLLAMAIVSVRPGMEATEDDVIEFLNEHGVKTGKITKWMLPKLVAITSDIPKTSVGKYNKKAVRDDLDRFLSIAKETSQQQPA